MQQFERYGEIQSVDIRCNNSTTGRKGPFAYVTFSDSLAAIKAVDEYPETANEKFKIQPADTWHQPGARQCPIETPADVKPRVSLHILNDDCLLKIFEMCDLETLSTAFDVCQRFRQLIQGTLSKYRSFTLDVGKKNLQQIRQTLRLIGSGINKLQLDFEAYFLYTIRNRLSLDRLLQKIAQYVRGSIEELTITNLRLTDDVLEQLTPLLAQIKVLKIDNEDYNEDFNYDVDFRQYCPNLITLKVNESMTFVSNSGPWRCLENVTFARTYLMNGATFDTFCKNNPQLTKLRIELYESDDILNSISNHLQSLVKLAISSDNPFLPDTLLASLKTLGNLKKLELKALTEDDNLVGVFKMLSELKQLTHVKFEYSGCLNISIDAGQLIAIALNLTNLKVFLLKNVKVPEDAVVEFVKSALCLERLDIRYCNVKMSEQLLDKIVAARSIRPPAEIKLLEITVDGFEDILVRIRGSQMQFLKIKAV